jgi:predicted GIY-YIG superfamily endonuclease
MDNWWVYIIQKETKLYVGITTDLENRVRQHGRPNSPYLEGPMSKNDALKRERMLKGWSRTKKLDLIVNASPRKTEPFRP